MTIPESIFLGVIQGLTEFLPVSSDGHLQMGSALLGMTNPEQNLGFTVLVHVATVMASLVVFRNEIIRLFKGLLKFSWNDETKYVFLLMVSAIPVVIIGLFFEKEVEKLFGSNLILTGAGLLVTAGLLFITVLVPVGKKDVGLIPAILMGIGQAIAVLPGVSRSGTTISTAVVLGIDKSKAASFSFLMVIIPILGKATLDLKDLLLPDHNLKMAPSTMDSLGTAPLIIAFITSFIVGIFACSFLISMIKKSKLHYFGYYCVAAGILCLLAGWGIFNAK